MTTTIPEKLQYTAQHEWLAESPDGHWRIGITDFAQDALGDIVFVNLPAPDTAVTIGEPLGEVESTKSVSDIYAPVSGVVVQRNETLDEQPELVNTDPYGAGWMVELRLPEGVTISEVAGDLLTAEGYAELTASGEAGH